ncbi:hypothetical protein BV898_15150 [Hypsibius exemplaris]|uniref:Uncharacterized protein n=1 Tax=Hypsibius exemplaris TaxID=2072580 RepID=A0A9X6NA02_HYPEX|nr:hypothetical protein BV898_15150 [Hypsibius exemplaris]
MAPARLMLLFCLIMLYQRDFVASRSTHRNHRARSSATAFVRDGGRIWVVDGWHRDRKNRYGFWKAGSGVLVDVFYDFGANFLPSLSSGQFDTPSAFAPLLSPHAHGTPSSENPFLLSQAQDDQPDGTSSIDEGTQILTDCIYYADRSYTCRTNCDNDVTAEPLVKPFPNDSREYYTKNCTTDALTDGLPWYPSDHLIDKDIVPSGPHEVVATCTFYRTAWFECTDIMDCRAGPNRCRGGKQWRGSYTGSIQRGFQGKVTARSINGGGGPSPSVSVKQNDSCDDTERQMINFCKVAVADGVYINCYRNDKVCNSGICRTDITQTDELLPQKLRVSMGQLTDYLKPYPKMDFIAYCYFYANDDFHCVMLRDKDNGQKRTRFSCCTGEEVVVVDEDSEAAWIVEDRLQGGENLTELTSLMIANAGGGGGGGGESRRKSGNVSSAPSFSKSML